MFVHITAKMKDDGTIKIPLCVVKFLYMTLMGCV